jgi:hypothetical protein
MSCSNEPDTFTAGALAIVQLDDARRAASCAAAALRSMIGDATDPQLRAEASRLYEALRAAGDDIADLRSRCRVRGAAA